MLQCLMLTENMSKVHKEITIVLDFFYTKLFLNLPKAFLAYIENSFKEIKCIVRIRQTLLAVQGEYCMLIDIKVSQRQQIFEQKLQKFQILNDLPGFDRNILMLTAPGLQAYYNRH